MSLVVIMAIGIRRDRFLTFRGMTLILDSWKRILHVGLPRHCHRLDGSADLCFRNRNGGAPSARPRWPGSAWGYGPRPWPCCRSWPWERRSVPLSVRMPGRDTLTGYREARNWCIRFVAIYGLAVAAALTIFAEPIVALFTQDEGAMTAAVTQLRILPWTYCLLGVTITANGSLNALGKPLSAMIVSLCRTLLVYVPLSWLLGKFFGLTGVFLRRRSRQPGVGGRGYSSAPAWPGAAGGGRRGRGNETWQECLAGRFSACWRSPPRLCARKRKHLPWSVPGTRQIQFFPACPALHRRGQRTGPRSRADRLSSAARK